MPVFERRITFATTLPTPAQLHTRVVQVTGLAVILEYLDEEGVLSVEAPSTSPDEEAWITLHHRTLRTPCTCIWKQGMIWLLHEYNPVGYLEWVTTAALIDLGGQCSVTLPWYARLPWRERKWWQRIPR